MNKNSSGNFYGWKCKIFFLLCSISMNYVFIKHFLVRLQGYFWPGKQAFCPWHCLELKKCCLFAFSWILFKILSKCFYQVVWCQVCHPVIFVIYSKRHSDDHPQAKTTNRFYLNTNWLVCFAPPCYIVFLDNFFAQYTKLYESIENRSIW